MLQRATRGAMALGALAVIGFGLLFLAAPETALTHADHTVAKLPLVMGGRYLFLGGILLLALVWRDTRLQVALLIGFAGLAFLDALIYLGDAPWPHALTGLACCGAAALLSAGAGPGGARGQGG